MLRVRDYRDTDRNAVREIWDRFKEKYPGNYHFADGGITRVVIEENGKVVGVMASQAAVEISTMVDPDFGNPQDRLLALSCMLMETQKRLEPLRLKQLHAPLFPKLKGLARRMVQAGWVKDTRERLILDLRK